MTGRFYKVLKGKEKEIYKALDYTSEVFAWIYDGELSDQFASEDDVPETRQEIEDVLQSAFKIDRGTAKSIMEWMNAFYDQENPNPEEVAGYKGLPAVYAWLGDAQ